jgi:glyoxylase-like metal-dependent hydrolase (beta-lactamase superfamily II)/rhodanese-related sulfurtransferase
VIFKQFVDDDLGCASYLVGCEEAGEAVVVDPAYRIEPYLDEAERHDARLVRVLETHTHADHVSGHGRLALEHGLPVAIHSASAPEYPHDALADGDEVVVGNVTLRVLHTPGHRPEHCAFAVIDRTRASEPWLVLTGDSLFIGDAARPDLAVEAREGAEGLFHSLHRLVDLGDGVEVFPGHVAGSLCGAAMSSKASSTIGFERRFNHALTAPGLEEFVTLSIEQPVRPPNIERIVELNRGPFLAGPDLLRRLDSVPDDAVVLDVRDVDSFAAGHVHGALNVPLDGSSFATKAGFVLPPGQPVALHAGSDAEALAAAGGLRSVGFLELAGVLVAPEAAEPMATVEVEELEQMLGSDEIVLVDVREKEERDAGYIPGSRHIPYRIVRQAAENGLAGDRPVVTICESGARAAVAASVLAAAGVPARPVVHGGIHDWKARGGELVTFRRCGG